MYRRQHIKRKTLLQRGDSRNEVRCSVWRAITSIISNITLSSQNSKSETVVVKSYLWAFTELRVVRVCTNKYSILYYSHNVMYIFSNQLHLVVRNETKSPYFNRLYLIVALYQYKCSFQPLLFQSFICTDMFIECDTVPF